MNTTTDHNSIASDPSKSKGRLVKEVYSLTRSEFQRDRDRILHSAAFRRLKHKTQVFVSHEGDHYRTRLTHSLEVSQIARSICRVFSLNEDLAETLSISHDIGHPPFGHAGEQALSEAMINYGGFDHNEQAIRVVHLLEKKYFDFDGLNLTWETLEGLAKHNGPIIKNVPQTIVNLNDKFNLKLNEFSSIEAQIASIADDIAYNNHDLDDGLRAGFFTYEDLKELPILSKILDEFPNNYRTRDTQRINNEITRKSTALMIEDVINTIKLNIKKFDLSSDKEVRMLDGKIASFSDKFSRDVDSIKSFLNSKMYNHDKVIKMTNDASQIITFLFRKFMDDENLMHKDFKIRLENENKARVVCDYIAGMTDNYASEIYKSIK
tara:strand:- start:15604 stop:16740 length:1137 start_codon:yes stop_codon:yes gene_type:complete